MGRLIRVRPRMPLEKWGFPDNWGDEGDVKWGVPFLFALVLPERDL